MIPTQFLNIRDQSVQDLIWKYVIPEDIREGYTKLDAIKYIEAEIYSGNQVLIGNDEVILRCELVNKHVVEPHILGNGIYIRKTIEEAILLARDHSEMQRIVVWTQYKAIGRILEGCGFKLNATLEKYYLNSSGQHDMYGYTRDIK
jgi:hypothetical protein